MPGLLRPKYKSRFRRYSVVLFIIAFFYNTDVIAQQRDTTILAPVLRAPCQVNISIFPYDEGFETDDGHWFTGGQNSDWQRGTPAKTVINAAGQGTKCWVIGGLTGSSYNGAELSWLQSPCFDLSELIHPEITFKVLWESEGRFDGAGFEYSVDGGVTWNLLGTTNSNSTCLGTNWFNTGTITYLGTSGWSGNIQNTGGGCVGGGGSRNWVNARHSLENLVGETKVSFRFTFASGTTCNNFEGFAIDAIHIGEAPPNSANFNYTCGADRSVTFTAIGNCPTSTVWSFGDINSGAANTSSDPNPTHVFSAPGTYTVRLTSTFITGIYSETKTISVLDAATSITQQIKCFGDATGAVTVIPAGTTNPYTYEWNTTPVRTTQAIMGLTAGSYTVKVSSANSCPAQKTIVLTQPQAFVLDTRWGPSVCTANNGSIEAGARGGTSPYTYVWSNGFTGDARFDLAPGSYSITAKDANGCMATANNIVVEQRNETLRFTIGNDTTICPGEKIILSPGRFSTYQWQDNSTSPTFTVTSTGNYSVKVTNENGCVGLASVHVNVDCSDVFFPSAFTPNGDTRNEKFGPGGNVAALKNYVLTIYDRFGNRAFYSTNPFQKWDGKYKGAPYNSGNFVWIANYTLNGKAFTKKGTILLLR